MYLSLFYNRGRYVVFGIAGLSCRTKTSKPVVLLPNNAEIVELGHLVYDKNALPVPDSGQKNRQIGENELPTANPLPHRTIKPGILGTISTTIYSN